MHTIIPGGADRSGYRTTVPLSTPQPRYRVAVLGLGAQGTGIAGLAVAYGHDLVGAVDIGPRRGTRLADHVPSYTGDALVTGSIEELIDDPATRPDIVVLAAAVDLEKSLEIAGGILDRGVNVVTLNQDVFAFDESWTPRVHARAVAGGATLLGTGVQDTWWVQLIALAAAGVDQITKIVLHNLVPLEALSLGVGGEIGVPLSAEEFAVHTEATADFPSVIGAPLVELARRLGAQAGPVTKRVDPIFRDTEYEWKAAGVTLSPDKTQGVYETVSFDTDRGFSVEGVISVVPDSDEKSGNYFVIEGNPTTKVTFGPITKDSTDIALVARIPDVVAAAPGVIFSADLPPARHQFRRF